MEGKKGGFPLFLMVASGVFLSTLDSSMVNIALPSIMEFFGVTFIGVGWVALVYLLTVSTLLLIWGKLGDRFGRQKVFIAGAAIFTLGGIGCFLSLSSFFILVSSRFVQGVGASMIMATGPAIIKTAVDEDRLGRWLGILGVATSLGLMFGPVLGGYLLQQGVWNRIFIPAGLVGATLTFCSFLLFKGVRKRPVSEKRALPRKSVFLWAVFSVLFVFSLNGAAIFSPMLRAALLICASCVGFLFILVELKADAPLLPLVLLKRKYFAVAMVSTVTSFASLFFVLILMPFYLHSVLKYSYAVIGYTMTAIPLSLFIISPCAGVVYDRYGGRYLTGFGAVISGVSIVLLTSLDGVSTWLDIIWRLALLGAGQAIFVAPNTATVLSRVPLHKSGVSASMLATSRNLGMLLGVCLVGLLFDTLFARYTGGATLQEFTPQMTEGFMRAFSATLLCSAMLAFTTAILSIFRE